jgi:hypothetical protein
MMKAVGYSSGMLKQTLITTIATSSILVDAYALSF